MIIKTITNPEDVYICGFDLEGRTQEFSTTDDEDNIFVRNHNNKKYLAICGHVHILTKSELIPYLVELEGMSDSYEETILLKDFSGAISLSVEDDDGKDYLDPDYKGGVDKEDVYCRYRLLDDESDPDVDVVLQVEDFPLTLLDIPQVIKSLQ